MVWKQRALQNSGITIALYYTETLPAPEKMWDTKLQGWVGNRARKDRNVNSNERGIELGSETRPRFALSKQPCGVLQHFMHRTPRACLCMSCQAGNYSCLSQESWQQCRKIHRYLTAINCKWNKEGSSDKMGPPNHKQSVQPKVELVLGRRCGR